MLKVPPWNAGHCWCSLLLLTGLPVGVSQLMSQEGTARFALTEGSASAEILHPLQANHLLWAAGETFLLVPSRS